MVIVILWETPWAVVVYETMVTTRETDSGIEEVVDGHTSRGGVDDYTRRKSSVEKMSTLRNRSNHCDQEACLQKLSTMLERSIRKLCGGRNISEASRTVG